MEGSRWPSPRWPEHVSLKKANPSERAAAFMAPRWLKDGNAHVALLPAILCHFLTELELPAL